MNLGPWEILIIAVVIILLFGARKMPAMARSLGQSMRILKAETKTMRGEEGEDATAEKPATTSQPAAAQPVQPPAAQLPASAPEQTPEQLKKQIDDLQHKLDAQGQAHKNVS